MLTKMKDLGWHAIYRGVASMPTPLAARSLGRILPRWFVVEPTNSCNYRCPLCPQPYHPRARGRMRLAEFRGLVDEIRPFAHHVCLTELGEGLMNPDLLPMARYAEDAGIAVSINTNGELLDDHVDAILDSGLTMIKIAVDGIDAETQERYRWGSDFERVRRGVELLCAEKRRRGLAKPHVTILNLLFRYNLDQKDAMRRWGEEIGADRIGFKPVRLLSAEHVSKDPDAPTREELAAEFLPDDPALLHDAYKDTPLCRDQRVCPNFYEATILWNGDLVLCSNGGYDGHNTVGNVFRDGGFRRLWSSARRRELLAGVIDGENERCAACETPCQGRWLNV